MKRISWKILDYCVTMHPNERAEAIAEYRELRRPGEEVRTKDSFVKAFGAVIPVFVVVYRRRES